MKKVNLVLACLLGLSLSQDGLSAGSNEAAEEKSPRQVDEADGDEPPPPPPGMQLASPKFTLGVTRAAVTSAPPRIQLQLNSSLLTNSDLSDTGAGSRTISDTIFVNAATLRFMPKVLEHTYVAADVGGAFIRYDGSDDNDYDVLNANAGLLQELGERTVGELGWRYSQFFAHGALTDLQEQGVRLAIRRSDPLWENSFLLTNYELQANFSQPSDRSRVSHYFRAGLGYNITPRILALADYSLRYDDFFNRSGDSGAARHEFRAQVSYSPWDNFYAAANVSYLLGDPVDILVAPGRGNPTHDLSNLSFGFHLGLNLPLLE